MKEERLVEDNTFDKKSFRLFNKKNPDWDELVKDCVGFANARGGTIIIGIEDDQDEPPVNQKIDKSLPHKILKIINGRKVDNSNIQEIKSRFKFIFIFCQRVKINKTGK